MAPVIWGLNLAEIQWYKFGHKYMFGGTYHMQTTRMIVYQLAMIFMVVSESVGTAALSDYVDQQDGIQTRTGYHVQNNDIVGVLSYNIFCGIAVATIFGAGFFFDLFFPERLESPGVKLAWKISAIVVSFMALADAIAITVIVATREAHIDNISKSLQTQLFHANGPPNSVYRHNAYCVASCVLCWIGVVSTFAAAYVLFRSYAHIERLGPFSRRGKASVSNEKAKIIPAEGHTGVNSPANV